MHVTWTNLARAGSAGYVLVLHYCNIAILEDAPCGPICGHTQHFLFVVSRVGWVGRLLVVPSPQQLTRGASADTALRQPTNHGRGTVSQRHRSQHGHGGQQTRRRRCRRWWRWREADHAAGSGPRLRHPRQRMLRRRAHADRQ